MIQCNGFIANDLGNGIFAIQEPTSLYMYLIVGENKAALIDTGVGTGDLKGCVRRLTDKPVTVFVTHYHHDHAGGVCGFDQVMVPELDVPSIGRGTSMEERIRFLQILDGCSVKTIHGGKMADLVAQLVPERTVDIVPVMPGYVLDLGGRTIRAMDMGGHSPGSMGYFDSATGTLFAGDACNNNTFLFAEDSLDISTYREKLKALKDDLGKDLKRMVICHEYTFVPVDCIDNLIECCDIILAGKSELEYFETPLMPGAERYVKYAKKGGSKREDGKFGNLVYDTRRVG